MGENSLPSIFESVISALFVAVGIYVYVSLVRQIRVRISDPAVASRSYDWPEAILAILLCIWFLFSVVLAASHKVRSFQAIDLIVNAVFTIGLFLGLVAFLWLRRLDIGSLAGFSRIGFGRAATTGGLLLLAAYPLVLLAEFVTRFLAKGAVEKQEIIEVFTGSSTLEQRISIIVMAVAVAPLTEEFFFRFFLYGVMKRYLGRSFGVLANSFIFAAVHAHLPSFAPLFVLGACLTIAYEWSGSILVSMTMHALFNALALTALAFPEVFPQ